MNTFVTGATPPQGGGPLFTVNHRSTDNNGVLHLSAYSIPWRRLCWTSKYFSVNVQEQGRKGVYRVEVPWGESEDFEIYLRWTQDRIIRSRTRPRPVRQWASPEPPPKCRKRSRAPTVADSSLPTSEPAQKCRKRTRSSAFANSRPPTPEPERKRRKRSLASTVAETRLPTPESMQSDSRIELEATNQLTRDYETLMSLWVLGVQLEDQTFMDTCMSFLTTMVHLPENDPQQFLAALDPGLIETVFSSDSHPPPLRRFILHTISRFASLEQISSF